MRKLTLLFAVFASLLLQPAVLSACSCGPTIFVSKPHGPNHVVIVAKITSVIELGKMDGQRAGYSARGKVLDYFWGPRERILSDGDEVRLNGRHGECSDFAFIEGRNYFISGEAEEDGTVSVRACGFSGELEWDRSQLNLLAIAYGRLGGSGAVLGRLSRVPSNEPVGGVEVTLVGEGGKFRTKTADDGTYLVLGLPEGTYDVKVANEKPRYRPVPVRVFAGEYTNGSVELKQR